MEGCVSVLVPAFNASRWLRETLASIADQTYRNIEVVIVDDGSQDDTFNIAREAAAGRLRWRVVRQENRGQTAALNEALRHAGGEYVQFLDADDVLHPRKIEFQVDRLRNSPRSIASASWGRFYSSVAETQFVPDDTWQDLRPVEWLVRNWSEGGGMMFPGMWLVPMSIVQSIGPWREDLTLLNDTEYFPRAILASGGVLHCREARVCYRSGVSGSLSGAKSQAALVSAMKVFEACEARLLAAEDSERTRRALSAVWQRFAHDAYPHDPRVGNEALRRGLSLYPEFLSPLGGPKFRVVSRIVGWKIARRAQVWASKRRIL